MHIRHLKRWESALKDRRKLDTHAEVLVEFNDSLLKMCSERAAEVSQRSIWLSTRLPDYLETLQWPAAPRAVSKVREPILLCELLEKSAGTASPRDILDLKVRVQLAMQLV